MNPILGIMASQNYPRVTNSYESIATVTGTGSAATLSFTSIPSTFKHIQIRGNWTGTSGSPYMKITFNSDNTGANYYSHGLFGNGSTAGVDAWPGSSYSAMLASAGSSGNAGNRYAMILDVLDYANTSKNKTQRVLSGWDANGTGAVELDSGAWFSTSAISSIQISVNTGAFASTSQFALYGIKG